MDGSEKLACLGKRDNEGRKDRWNYVLSAGRKETEFWEDIRRPEATQLKKKGQ